MLLNMIFQIGQTTQPRIPPSTHFPTTVVCRVHPFDGPKLNQSGLPETFFQVTENSSGEEFPDLNETWNNVTMGVGHTLNVSTFTRFWDGSKGKQCIQLNFYTTPF